MTLDAVRWLDGGLSTALERLGFSTRHELWTARALVDAPDLLVEAHRQFLRAGAEVLLTASYQAGLTNLTRHLGSEVEARRVLASSVHLARQAARTHPGPPPRVAASVGAYGALLADRSEYHGRYDATWDEVAREHRARFEVLLDASPDVVVCETLPTVAEAAVMLDVLDDLMAERNDVEVWITFTAVEAGFTAAGDPLVRVDELLRGRPWLRAVGVNCTRVSHVAAALHALGSVTDLPLIAAPNGVPEPESIRAWRRAGARYVGGCCGVGPAELAQIASTAI